MAKDVEELRGEVLGALKDLGSGDSDPLLNEVTRWRDVCIYHLRESYPDLADIADRLQNREVNSSVDYAHHLRAIANELADRAPAVFNDPELREDWTIKNEGLATLAAHTAIMAISMCLAREKAMRDGA